jgi:hypothetical protein
LPAWNPRQVSTQNIDGYRSDHEDCADPEAPVTMHSPPVRARIRLAAFAAVSFVVVLASGHFFSISASYSRLRKIAQGFMHYG